ncbi:MAG: ribonuclease Z [Candidatus Kariarchaeaceae archaeon]|jgi:ribonuclease Z
MSGTDIVISFLGTGATIPPDGRTQVSFALRHTHGLVLFDCGEGTQFALRKFKISTRKEFIICISHLHSDHFLGLPGLLSSFQLQGREQAIKIVGPEGIKDLVEGLILANYIQLDYPLKIYSIRPGESFQGKQFTLLAFKAIHEANALSFVWKESDRPGKMNMKKISQLGIPQGPLVGKLQRGESVQLEEKIIHPSDVQSKPIQGRSVAYSGDTSPNIDFIKALPENCDALVHEGTYPSELSELALERGHSTILDAAQLLSKDQVKQLILTHISPRITDLDGELALIKKYFPNTVIAYEGMQVIIKFNRS